MHSPRSILICTAILLASLAGCSTGTQAPLRPTTTPVDLERFMGDWYVLAHIPIDLPLVSEARAHNAVESYRLDENGIIETTYRFLDGGFDGPETIYTPRAWVAEPGSNAEWRMQFLWPFRSAYLIVYLDPTYSRTIIGVPNRGNAWIMARTPQVSDEDFAQLVAEFEALGHDREALRIVPHDWSEADD